MFFSTLNAPRGAMARAVLPVCAAAFTLLSLPWSASAQTPDLGPGASLRGKFIFPMDSPWNQDVSTLPVDPNSATLIGSIGLTGRLHPDFGADWNGGPFGIPYVVVEGTQPRVPVRFDYADESDAGPYPIPADAPIEGGASSTGDRHVLMIDRDNWKLYELFYAVPQADGSWHAGSGAIFDLTSGAPRPQGWTSADAAGLPIFPGLVRYDEVVEQGAINHALRFTVTRSRRAFVFPARHFASSLTESQYPPMGMRVRLKAGFDISQFPPQARVILTALKKYGMFVADNGSNWFLSGAPDARWNDNDLGTLKQVPGSAFEVVQMGDVVTDTVAPPAGLTASGGVGQISLNWTARSGASGYNVKRSTVRGGPYSSIAPSLTANAFVDKNVSAGTAYYYVVTSVNATGQSYDSLEAAATPAAGAAVLAAPSGLKASTTSRLMVNLSWTNNAASAASRQRVQFSRDAINWSDLTTASASAASLKTTSLSASTRYYFRVRAENASGTSAWSNTASVTTSRR